MDPRLGGMVPVNSLLDKYLAKQTATQAHANDSEAVRPLLRLGYAAGASDSSAESSRWHPYQPPVVVGCRGLG